MTRLLITVRTDIDTYTYEVLVVEDGFLRQPFDAPLAARRRLEEVDARESCVLAPTVAVAVLEFP